VAFGNVASRAANHADGPVGVFLMINSFETGGSERQFVALAKNLGGPRFGVHLGCLQSIGPLAAEVGSVPEFPLGGSLYGIGSLRTRWQLSRHLRAHRVQVAQAFDFYTNLTLIPAARLARVPVVIGSQRQIGDLLTPAKARAQAATFRWCDGVVCNSQAAAERLAEQGVTRRKLVVIGNAIAPEAFAPAPPALPRTPGVWRVGMVARMNARSKNHSGFLRVAMRVRTQVPNVEFLLVGDGPLRPELEREARDLGLGNSVVFCGDRRDIPAVQASLDVAVLTSESESLSNAILEAMAAGLPVVAYRNGGNPELIDEQRGTLIAQGDDRAFAEAVVHLLTETADREHRGRNARRFVEENFSLERCRARYRELYERLLKEKGVKVG
jgi:L-malate glycosyltransferase